MHETETKQLLVLILFLSSCLVPASSSSRRLTCSARKPHAKAPSHKPPCLCLVSSPAVSTNAMALRGGGKGVAGGLGVTDTSSGSGVLKDCRAEASSLFGNLRIPAALFAGASAGAAFAMPLGGDDGLKVGVVKRAYALLMIGSLSSQIVTVLTATLAVASLSVEQVEMTRSVSDLLRRRYDLEWTTSRLNFLSGLVMFAVASGLRAWVSIACPVFARAALGFIVSATLLCLAFVRDTHCRSGGDSMTILPIRFVVLASRRAGDNPLFAVALAAYACTWAYTIWGFEHVWKYLAADN